MFWLSLFPKRSFKLVSSRKQLVFQVDELHYEWRLKNDFPQNRRVRFLCFTKQRLTTEMSPHKTKALYLFVFLNFFKAKPLYTHCIRIKISLMYLTYYLDWNMKLQYKFLVIFHKLYSSSRFQIFFIIEDMLEHSTTI